MANRKFSLGFLGFVLIFFFSKTSVFAQVPQVGFPRIYNLWGGSNSESDNAYFSGFNVYMMYLDGSRPADQARADAIHALNPNTKILITADIIPAHPVGVGLDNQPQWWTAVRGTPDYACIIRDTSGNIIRDATYNAAHNNLTDPYCRNVLVNHFINRWNLSGGHFDGWQVDQAGDYGISWNLLNSPNNPNKNFDVNVDGVADNPATVDASYTAGMIDIFRRLRAAIPQIIINANDSPPYYGEWVNGRLYEMDLKRYLDGETTTTWTEIMKMWSSWTVNNTNLPNTTSMVNSPRTELITSKYTFQNIWNSIKPAMMMEYGSDYDRMRFGLVSTIMAGGIYTYDLSGYMYGVNWWYDEYGKRGDVSSLGYLGLPADSPRLISAISSPDQVVNGSFNTGSITPWFTSTNGANVVTSSVENGVARLHMSGATSGWSVLRENYVTVETGKYYTVSFKARSDASRFGEVRVQRAGGAWEYLTEGEQIHFYDSWTDYRLPLKATGSGTNGTLLFDLGISAGDIYIDDIKFQEGVGGIWQQHFEKGTIILNESPVAQNVTLDKTYKKLSGSQAPLYSQRIDDDEAIAVGGWTNPAANFDQWGTKVHAISAPSNSATLTYNFNVAYPGEYEVLAWSAPSASYSKNVTVSVNGTNVNLDESVGVVGWQSIGKYNFNQNASVVIKPLGTGTVIGDAIKIVSTARYNGGSTVNSIRLQSKDAIILLNTQSQTPTQTLAPGDANGDGRVDGRDYVVWLNHFNQNTNNGSRDGDFNSSRLVDGVDYVIWLNNYQN